MKKLPVLMALAVVLSLPFLVSFGLERSVKIVPIFLGQARRTEVNTIIENNIAFYTKEYAKKEKISNTIAETIIIKAITANAPINLAFSLARNESLYDPAAYNKNEDGSYDFGLFQLNSNTFGDVKKTHKNIDKNTYTALIFLQELYAVYGSYDLALIAYNCGKVKRFNDRTQQHLINILRKEEELDTWFNSKYRDEISRGIDQS